MNAQKTLKLLSIGNSFSVDTMEHVANIAKDLGVSVKLGNLYVGGCSIRKHHEHAMSDAPVYKYYTNTGNGWSCTPEYKISDAVCEEEWDWISIQHGSKDGSRYSAPEDYALLPALLDYVKEKAWNGVKFAFNMAWVGEPYDHHEITLFGGDQLLFYKALTAATQQAVAPIKDIAVISPTGTAVQNARTAILDGRLSRDGFHLSYDIGRYIAGMTWLATLTGVDVTPLRWAPEGVSETDIEIAKESVENALRAPYTVTHSRYAKKD